MGDIASLLIAFEASGDPPEADLRRVVRLGDGPVNVAAGSVLEVVSGCGEGEQEGSDDGDEFGSHGVAVWVLTGEEEGRWLVARAGGGGEMGGLGWPQQAAEDPQVVEGSIQIAMEGPIS
jgi:hypothetical protein